MRAKQPKRAYFLDDDKKIAFFKEAQKLCLMNNAGIELFTKTIDASIQYEVLLLFAVRKFASLSFTRVSAIYDLYPGELPKDKLLEEIMYGFYPYKYPKRQILHTEEDEEVLKKVYAALEVLIKEFEKAIETNTLEKMQKQKKCFLDESYHKNPEEWIENCKNTLKTIRLDGIKEIYSISAFDEFKGVELFRFFSLPCFHATLISEQLNFGKKKYMLFTQVAQDKISDKERHPFVFEKHYRKSLSSIDSLYQDIKSRINGVFKAYKKEHYESLASQLNEFLNLEYVNHYLLEPSRLVFNASTEKKYFKKVIDNMQKYFLEEV